MSVSLTFSSTRKNAETSAPKEPLLQKTLENVKTVPPIVKSAIMNKNVMFASTSLSETKMTSVLTNVKSVTKKSTENAKSV